jgi:hypothetical protein
LVGGRESACKMLADFGDKAWQVQQTCGVVWQVGGGQVWANLASGARYGPRGRGMRVRVGWSRCVHGV